MTELFRLRNSSVNPVRTGEDVRSSRSSTNCQVVRSEAAKADGAHNTAFAGGTVAALSQREKPLGRPEADPEMSARPSPADGIMVRDTAQPSLSSASTNGRIFRLRRTVILARWGPEISSFLRLLNMFRVNAYPPSVSH